jgi:diguanylate cyclase (GGDEF)-like protein/PAS domain S-box-containing protein
VFGLLRLIVRWAAAIRGTARRWFRADCARADRSWNAAAQAAGTGLEEDELMPTKRIEQLQTEHKEHVELLQAQRLGWIGNWTWNLATDAVTISAELYRLFALDPTRPCPDFQAQRGTLYPVEVWEQLNTAMQRAVNTGVGYELTVEARRTDGTPVLTMTRGEVVRDLAGRITGLRGIAQDVAERKRADDELLVSRQRLDGIIHSAMDAILVMDEEHRIVVSNPAAEMAFGYTTAELLGMPLSMLLPESFRAAHARQITAFEESGVTSRKIGALLPVTGLRRNGEEFQLETAISVDRSTGKTFFTAIMRDISERLRSEAELVANRNRLALATQSANIGIWEWDIAANRLIWDARIYELYGIREQDFSGAYAAWNAALHPDDRARCAAEIAVAIAGQSNLDLEFRIVWPSGEVRNIEGHARVQRGADGIAARMIGVNMDITQRKQADSRIAYLNRVYAVMSGINSLIVRAHDRDELFRDACHVALDAGGFCMAYIGIVDRVTAKLVVAAAEGMDDALLDSIAGVVSSDELAAKTKAAQVIKEGKVFLSNDAQSDPQVLLGRNYAIHEAHSLIILPLIVANEVVGVLTLFAREPGFFHDKEVRLLTELAADIAFAIDHIDKQERLTYLAYYDPLTGLPNRSLFLDRLAQHQRLAISTGNKLVVGLVDLERFKNINVSLGRPAGDELLRQMAQWLIEKSGDPSLLARVDADRFAVVLPEIRSDRNLPGLVESLIKAFAEHPFRLNDAQFRIGIKVGFAMFPDDGTDAAELLRNAEAALKKAKGSGMRYLFYTPKMTTMIASQLALENQLRDAIDNHEFVLHYQPKVNLASGKVTGAEALIRWNDPLTGRLVPPGLFIPVLEETGLIHEVGRWALGQAIKDLSRWSSTGLAGFRIAVNVSQLQLRHLNFIDEIRRFIAVDPCAASGLELEITESMIMDDIEHNIAYLKKIRELGITIAIDDFGTGFSSLGYLARLPVDTLKIDRSFVIDMTAGPEGLALVSTIINLAHAMKLKVVAEGVETEEQSRLLRLLRCDEMQGYLFSKPVPGGVFEANFLAVLAEEL